MLKKPKALALTLATMLAAGCAHSDQSALMGPVQWKSGKAPDYSRAKQAPEPKILPQTYFAAGQLLEQEGQYAKAAIQYRKATAVNHKYVAAYHQLGIVLTKMGALDEATQSLAKAVKMAPKNALIRNNLGFAYMLQQRWPDAAEQFQRCIELHPELSRAHINLGMTLAKMDRFDDAYLSFRAVLAEPDAYYNLGLMYRARGRLTDAASSFRNALAVNPDFYAASVQLQNVESTALAMNTTTGETARPIKLGIQTSPQQTLTQMESIDAAPVTTPTPRLISLEEQMDDAPPMSPETKTIGSMQPIIDEPATVPTQTRDAMIALQPDRGIQVDRGEPMQAVKTPRPATVAPRNPQPRIRPLAEVRKERSMATEASVTRIVESRVPANAIPPMPTMDPLDETTAVATTTTHQPDLATLPQPNRNPEYTIIGPDEDKHTPQTTQIAEVTHDIPTMTLVESTGEQATDTQTSSTNRTTMSSMITIATPINDQRTPLDTAIGGFSEDYSLGVCVVDGLNVCNASVLEPITIGIGTTCPADYANEVLTMASLVSVGRHEDRLPPVDSEAIINAFENHIYNFADEEVCWDEIDWQSWEVIDPDIVAARIADVNEKMATTTTVEIPERVVQISTMPTASPRMGTATLITESWVESNEPGDAVLSDDLGDFMKLVEMERVQIDAADDAALPTTTVESLRTELKQIREEIRCLDDEVPNTAKSGSEANEVSTVRIIPEIDFATEMNPVSPPVKSSALSELAANEPTALDRSQMDVATFVPSTMPNTGVAIETTNIAAMDAVKIHDPAADLPILVREAPAVPQTTKLIAEVEPTPITSGSTDGVLTIVMEDTEGNGCKKRSTEMGTMVVIEPNRPTLSSSIDEPKTK